jgi:two-component system, chemotaxis family, CheB/CheR fusion protein
VHQVNNDLSNLFSSIYFAVVIVGSDLTIRRFTPQAQKFLGLIPADVGRPLINIHSPVEIPDFQTLVLQVMSTSIQLDREFTDHQGGHYQLRILPYRTADNKVDGAVITIVDVSSRALGEAAN